MQDDLERTGESPAASGRPAFSRMTMLDASSAVRLAENAVGSRVHDGGDAHASLVAAEKEAENGVRAAVVADIGALVAARAAMRHIAHARLAMVAHALAGHAHEDLAALLDLGWGVLVASGPEDSFDLALVARRAAEDASVPFVVVHALAHPSGAGGRALAVVALPYERALQSFVGPASRVKPKTEAKGPGGRAFLDRVPFALGSALREYGVASGRRHDVFDRAPLGEAPLVLVGMGPVGDALLHATNELRARGFEVSAINLTTLRPFPGARIVKALARALAVTVLEAADEPLAHGGLLAREVKASFTDALTWAPGFPGIGRVPKLFSGVSGAAFDLADLQAVCDNMLMDERGKRSFSFIETEHALARPQSEPAARPDDRTVAFRWVVDDANVAERALEATSIAFTNALGLRLSAIVSKAATGGAVVDMLASRDHARGTMARRAPRVVLATERGAATAEAAFGLAEGSVLGVLGDGALPDAARSLVRERRARVMTLAPSNDPQGIAATLAGASLAAASRAARSAIDGALVARLIAEHFSANEPEAAGDRAQRAFDAMNDALASGERDAAAEQKAVAAGKPVGMA